MRQSAEEYFSSTRGILMLWAGILLGPIGWAVHLGVSYNLVLYVCRTGEMWLMHLTTVVSLGIAGLGLWIAWRSWRRTGEPSATTGSSLEGRSRFMAVFGLVSSGFSMLLIAVEGLPNFILLPPCSPVSEWVTLLI